jgi:hypothetical protein
MLTGTSAASAPQRSADLRPGTATAKHADAAEVAKTFRDKLHALGKEQREASHAVRAPRKMEAEGHAWAPVQPDGVQAPADRSKHERTAGSVTDVAHLGQPHEQRAETQIASPGASGAGDPASTALTAQFAERLALPAQMTSETQVLFDISRYAVSSVTVTGGSKDGLSLSYEGHSNGEGGQHDEEALRQRLEARGLKVVKISGRS